MFPLTTLNEKKSFLKEAVENDYILFFEHDPVHECCTLQQTERGIRPKDFFKLEEVICNLSLSSRSILDIYILQSPLK